MQIIISYTWYRSTHNYDSVTNTQFLTYVDRSKKAVTQAIRDWAKSWSGKGYIKVSSVRTTFADDNKFCDIAQKRFNFNNGYNM